MAAKKFKKINFEAVSEKLSNIIVKKRLIFTIIFGVLLIASIVGYFFVEVNYNDLDYLPDDSELKIGITEMYADFGENGSASAMISNVTVTEAMGYKDKIAAVSGVQQVIWIDDLMASFIDAPMATVQNAGYEISKAQAMQYIMDIIYALPENASDLSTLELTQAVMGASDGSSEFLRFTVALIPTLTGGDLDVGLISVFKPQIEGFFKDGNALFTIMFTGGDYDEGTINAIGDIRAISGDLKVIGNSATTYNSKLTISNETMKAMVVAVIIVLAILFLTSTSWWEPVLYLIVIGVAVLLNMGSNVILGEISYMTSGVGSVLQLALTMDYSIFLLNRYKRERKEGKPVEDAMSAAVRQSLSPISASSLTTIASFVALMFMSYKMGFDIGIVLAKGVVLSIATVFFLMPALVVYTNKLIEKSEHKSFNFTFKKTSKFLVRSRFVLPILIIAIILPCIYFQGMNEFTYGNEASLGSEGTQIAEDKKAVEAVFGNQNQLVILIPKSAAGAESELTYGLMNMDGVLSAQSLSVINESGFADILPSSFLKQFDGAEKYNRIVLNLGVEGESAETTALIEKIDAYVEAEIGEAVTQTDESYYILGESPATLEIKSIVNRDYDTIMIVSIVLVGVVLIFTFKSLPVPVLLVAVIEASIYVNMAVPFLTGQPIVFIGYLLVSAILLGATIDYAILMTSHYMENRVFMNKFDAARYAIAQSARALITSAGILTFAGFSIGIVSSMPATSVFGMAIGRGGLIAFALVMFLLPQLLILLDGLIRVTTINGKKKMIDNTLATAAPELGGKKED